MIEEYVSAIEYANHHKTDVVLWPDVEPERKDTMGLPEIDVGVDHVTDNLKVFGQAKCYRREKPFVSAKDTVRRHYCALIASEHDGVTVL